MMSLSHWGMFEAFQPVGLPKGFRLPSRAEVDREMARPDGMIKLIPMKINPSWLRSLSEVD